MNEKVRYATSNIEEGVWRREKIVASDFNAQSLEGRGIVFLACQLRRNYTEKYNIIWNMM